MRQIVFFICLVFVLMKSIIAQPPPPPPMKTYPLTAWKEFNFAEGWFSVSFPTKPKESKKTESANGIPIEVTTYEVRTGDGSYTVIYTKLPQKREESEEQLKERLRETLKRLSQGKQYKWVGGKEIQIDGYPGIEFQYELLDGQELIWQRMYSINDRVYRIISDTFRRDPALKEPQIFHDSFKFNPPPPPPKISAGTKPPQAAPNAPPQPAPLQAYPLEAWQVRQFPQVGFAASFPAKPLERIKPAARSGAQRVSTEYKVVAQDGTYSVTLIQLIGQGIADKEQVKQSLGGILKSLEQGPYKWLGGKEIELEGFPGIEYQYQYLQLDEVSWQRMFFVDDRIYTIIADRPLNKPEAKEPKLFMESFKLLALSPDGIGAPPPPPPPAPGQSFGQELKPGIIRVSGGVLTGAAIKKIHPRYPSEALSSRATGAVDVAIVVSEEGKVLEAKAVSGPALLREAAVSAAQQWTFKPIGLSGAPVKFQGVLTFNFTLQ